MRLKSKDRCENLLDALLFFELVDQCLAKLKVGKSAGGDKLTVEHLKNAHPIVVYIADKTVQYYRYQMNLELV